jgi:hypothetical protein
VFPLPQDAAVSEFGDDVGDRHIRGIIREREQAERLYVEARQQGYVASLLTQERPNIFTQAVANIEPGKQIDIDLTYYNPLAYHDGDYEFVFPMVVGPRFNPPGSTDGIGAVPAGQYGAFRTADRGPLPAARPAQRSRHRDARRHRRRHGDRGAQQPDARHRHQGRRSGTSRRDAASLRHRAQQGLRPALPPGRRRREDGVSSPIAISAAASSR